MKHLKHLFAVLLLLCSAVASAHDFELAGVFYNITDETNKTVEVTFKGTWYSEYSQEYTGSVVIPETVEYNGVVYSVTSIGDRVFFQCSGLESITIPNSVTIIGDYAFNECSGLTSVTIPNNLTSIGAGAFKDCYRLTTDIVIPVGVTSIGEYAFYGCSGLTSIEIPNSVTSIGKYAFYNCTGLTSIEIPNSVTSIGSSAFRGCTGLESITIPSGVTIIESFVFYNCTGLKSITIPNSVTYIGSCVFSGCSGLESITIPNSVRGIGGEAFYNCSGLASITVNSKTPPVLQSNYTFSGTATIYVPYGAKATYQAANYWKNIANIEELPGEYSLAVTAAGYATLYLSYAVEIPEGVEVYYAESVEGDLLKMEQITGYIPANTGVIVKANEGTYSFNVTDEEVAAIEGNLLKGSAGATTVEAKSNAQYYVLSKVDGVVGMYLAQLDANNSFLNNANKAYLELTLGDLGIYDDELDTSVSGAQLGTGYRFDFGGTTGVGEVKGESEEVKGVYDLQGRKVKAEGVNVKGIYIINGKKTLVK